ncbi:MAG: FAD-dependent oxidoreductase [bacterium]|nr:MAG: FAD-dependent oxidoreductase [bacterium]
MGKELVLAGCGHAHLRTLLHCGDFLKRGHRVRLISPSAYHYYSGMGPGLVGGTYNAAQIRFHIRKMGEDRGAEFVQGKVQTIDPHKRELILESGKNVAYDVVSFNVGSYVPLDFLEEADEKIYTPKPIENLVDLRKEIEASDIKGRLKIAVAGAGADGVEFAGNFWKACQELEKDAEIRLISSGKILSQTHPRARTLALRSLQKREIQVIEDEPVVRYRDKQLITEAGRDYDVDIVLFTVGIRPMSIFSDSGVATDKDGALLTNRYLQSVDHPEIFGGGDCVNLKDIALDKVGVYATRQGPILLHNLMASLEGAPLVRFEKTGPYQLMFNMGDGTAIYWRKNIVWGGKLAFKWKNAIDQKFMRTFQVSGELDELD